MVKFSFRFLCFWVWLYNIMIQRKIKSKPRIKFNHTIYQFLLFLCTEIYVCVILYLLLYQYSHLIHLKGHFLQLFSGKCSIYISSDSHLNKHSCIKSILWLMKTDLNLMGKKHCFLGVYTACNRYSVARHCFA